MANDRMYLLDTRIGKYVFIAKHFGVQWVSFDTLADKLNKFFDETGPAMDLTAFRILYESDKDFLEYELMERD